jgi:hypothetical protein
MKTQLIIQIPGYQSSKFNIQLICCFLVLITACSVFREKSFLQADSLRLLNTSMALEQESARHREAITLNSSANSSEKQSLTEIYPTGPFRYSVKDGFSGKADRLVINERLKENKEQKRSAGVKESSSDQLVMKKNEKSRLQSRLKEVALRPKNIFWLYLAGILLLFVMIWRFRRFLA